MNELKEFTNKIMRISAPAISMFGYGLPGMAGGSAAEQGAMTPASDTIHKLKREAAEFNRLLNQNLRDGDKIKQIASDIEGDLLGLQALSVLDERQTDDLIDKLKRITSELEKEK